MADSYSYPIHLKIDYSTNTEYRQCCRELFSMDPTKIHQEINKYNETELDNETRDEEEYDMDAAINAMDFIFEKTKDHPVFQQLYEKAAGLLLSTNLDHGLPILFSFDYLALFHPILCGFFANNGAMPTELESQVLQLSNKISR